MLLVSNMHSFRRVALYYRPVIRIVECVEYDIVHLRLAPGSAYTWCGRAARRCLTTLHVHDTDCAECVELLAVDEQTALRGSSWSHDQDPTSQHELPTQGRPSSMPP